MSSVSFIGSRHSTIATVDTLSMAIDGGTGELVAFARQPPDTVTLGGILMHTKCGWIAAVVVGLGLTVASAQDNYIGVWSGGWEGPGGASGGFELTLEKGKDAALTG